MDVEAGGAEAGQVESMMAAEIEGDAEQEAEHADAGYIQMFLLKYVCPQADCFGTMVPQEGSDVYECNMCGFSRTNAEFLTELDAQLGQ